MVPPRCRGRIEASKSCRRRDCLVRYTAVGHGGWRTYLARRAAARGQAGKPAGRRAGRTNAAGIILDKNFQGSQDIVYTVYLWCHDGTSVCLSKATSENNKRVQRFNLGFSVHGERGRRTGDMRGLSRCALRLYARPGSVVQARHAPAPRQPLAN